MKNIFDVCIIGCGPAGNSLAYYLSKDDFSILLIDKEKLPRFKTCAGGVSKKTIEKIGYPLDKIFQKKIHSSYLTYKNEVVTFKKIEGIGVMTNREELDYFMTNKAISKGASLIQETAFLSYLEKDDFVEVITKKGLFKAKVLVGADGVYSKVRKQMFPNKKLKTGMAIEALIYPVKDNLEIFGCNTLFDFGGIKGGYGWIFPKKDHFNVGLFSINKKRGLKKDLEDFISRYKILKSYKNIKIKGWPIPIKPISSILNSNRVLLVGDAAGLGESFYGEGIYFSVWSSQIAHKSINSFLKKKISLKNYSLKSKKIYRELFFSRLTALIFYRFPKFGYYQMVRNKWVSYYFSRLINGNVSYTRCFIETLLFIPLWIFAPKYKEIDSDFLK